MWLYRLSQGIAPAIRGYWPVRARGLERYRDERGPLLLAANHSSFLDPWFIGMVFYRPVRHLMTDRWYDRNPAWNALFRAYGAIPVRSGDPRQTLAAVCDALSRGEIVGMFPEGRVSGDGLMARFRSGLAWVAARSGAPVLPVGIRGAFESLPRHRRFPRRVRVDVHFGEPLRFDGSPMEIGPSTKETAAFNDLLFRRIADLAGQAPIRGPEDPHGRAEESAGVRTPP